MPFRLDDCKSSIVILCCNFFLNFTIDKVFISDTYYNINLENIYLLLLYIHEIKLRIFTFQISEFVHITKCLSDALLEMFLNFINFYF